MPVNFLQQISILVLGMAMAGCSLRHSKNVIVDEKHTDDPIVLSKGDTLTITLIGNPSTGYIWKPKSLDTTRIRPRGEGSFEPDHKAAGIVGSGGKHSFHFEAVALGQTTIQLVYYRPFEPVTFPPVKTFKVTVQIK
jgi:inhibitor of cysteine peptidase